ncbi:MFS transporter [Actinoplanes sp. CA-030573]|uniref:MFS transporter n=1 Tax=Actinoplanes sp. CA-030573 TaxID=3239898 RepID=UPI003D8B38A8
MAPRRFRLFWTGDTISAAGGALSAVALPLLAIETLHASDAEVGVLRAAQTLPFLLLAVPVGLLADRVSRRRLLLTADLARAPLVLAIALAGAALPVSGLVALVFLIGVGTVAYEVAYLSVLPELVDSRSSLPAANRAVESSHAAVSLIGPAVGGALVAALGAAAVVAIDAVSFAVGALFTAVNRWPSGGSGFRRRPQAARELAAGWTWLWADGYVRPLTSYLAVNNLAAQAFQTALLLFVVRTLERGAAAVGFAVAATGFGFLSGALVSPGAARRFGTGRVLVIASLLGALGVALVAVSAGLPLVVAGSALAGLGSGLFNLHSIAVRQAVTPPPLLGRVNAVVKTISYGATTVGALAGGLAAAALGPRAVIGAAAVVSLGATACLLTPAVRTLTGIPEPAAPASDRRDGVEEPTVSAHDRSDGADKAGHADD